ncbi:endonuclease/exonuclease/phosphatase family protein [Pseudozobellia thermophila]|uniref:Metal-dependent hydrolase, endonuclease/exonuclease/phosphatase family n=1 Tax=Pseudozobellia thermophila TaxID=192903 RepID=A0A1M6NMH7_9FLAO|nr:endonuclease/exonuclease/phosphatase family protein [Pseudozobellia thermophila]SHJ96920.1 Metal-dependent hydrolase, endonuclease/exonuclease/phosphatase family [Pseudozobellia thermophila]
MILRTTVLLLTLVHFSFFGQGKATLISWNIQDFGQSKNAEELEQIAEIIREADIVAIQEVVAGYGGAQAVAKLSDLLNRKGSKWDYVISNPTNSSKYATERYAFLWKTSKIKIKNRGQLIKELDSLVDREPFFIDFYINAHKLTILNFHSRPHGKNPEAEIMAITEYLTEKKPEQPLILAGDFNVDEKEAVFEPLKNIGFKSSISNQKTTLKHKCDGNGRYLNYAIDNIFYSKNILKLQGGTIDYIKFCENLPMARQLSDHLPVLLKFQLQ